MRVAIWAVLSPLGFGVHERFSDIEPSYAVDASRDALVGAPPIVQSVKPSQPDSNDALFITSADPVPEPLLPSEGSVEPPEDGGVVPPLLLVVVTEIADEVALVRPVDEKRSV